MDRGMIVSVQFQAGEFRGDWNCELQGATGRPISTLSDRALDDAVLHAKELRDPSQLQDLLKFRDDRALRIKRHFEQCAKKLIDQVEEKEDWNGWLAKL